MKKTGRSKSPFSKIDHVGIIVRDLDKAIEYYQSLGIGPFESLNRNIASREVPGKAAGDIKLKNKQAQIGQVKLVLVEPVSGESPQKEFLESKGEGIDHIAFVVDDIDKEVGKLDKKRFKVVFRTKFLPSGGVVYLETNRIGGVILELIQLPPGESA